MSVAVILSGCGVYDGAEINEVVLTLLSLEENAIEYECFAPDIDQYHVVNHLTCDVVNEKRNVLQESSRIVRGKCKPLSQLDPEVFSGLVVPGGFGVAKNLSTLALDGINFTIMQQFMDVCLAFKQSHKPAAYMCIAPALLGKIYNSVHCTIGNDTDFSEIIEAHGGKHSNVSVDDVVVDEVNKVVTTPCYMLAENISQARRGVVNLISEFKMML